MSFLKLTFLLTFMIACGHLKPDANKVIVSNNAPKGNCQKVGEDLVKSKFLEQNPSKLSGSDLPESVIGDLVKSTCAKKANYIHVTKFETSVLKSSGREIAFDNERKLVKSKAYSDYYLCQ